MAPVDSGTLGDSPGIDNVFAAPDVDDGGASTTNEDASWRKQEKTKIKSGLHWCENFMFVLFFWMELCV